MRPSEAEWTRSPSRHLVSDRVLHVPPSPRSWSLRSIQADLLLRLRGVFIHPNACGPTECPAFGDILTSYSRSEGIAHRRACGTWTNSLAQYCRRSPYAGQCCSLAVYPRSWKRINLCATPWRNHRYGQSEAAGGVYCPLRVPWNPRHCGPTAKRILLKRRPANYQRAHAVQAGEGVPYLPECLRDGKGRQSAAGSGRAPRGRHALRRLQKCDRHDVVSFNFRPALPFGLS